MAERIHAGDFDSKVLADGTFALVDFTLTAVFHVKECHRCWQS